MDKTILEDIPFEPDFGELVELMHVRAGSSMAKDLKHMLDDAMKIARPKALYSIASKEERDETSVLIGGSVFESRILKVNLENAHRVFLYTATCGLELYEWKISIEDTVRKFYAESINGYALYTAIQALDSHLDEKYKLGLTSRMNPGSLSDWPIQAQIPLFKLLGDTESTIGIRLLDSLLMIPGQSVSGIRFETETSFASCQLCPMAHCPNRQAPYDKRLFDKRYALDEGEFLHP